MSFDAEGRLSLETRSGTEHLLPADAVIFAIGQAPDLGPLRERLPAGVAFTRRGTIEVDPEPLQTGHPAVFAGGDAVTSTTWAIEAIAAGHRAARSIDRHLRGQPLSDPSDARPAPVEVSAPGWLEVVLMEQAASTRGTGKRRLVHLVNQHGDRPVDGNNRCTEQILPVREVEVRVRLEHRPDQVTLEPDGKTPGWRYADGLLTVAVPEVHIHRMVAIE